MLVHRLTSPVRRGNACLLPQLVAVLRGFDVIHLHYPFLGGELTALAARLYRTPLVITYHQDVLLAGPWHLIEKTVRLTAGRAALRSADRVLFTSRDYGRASHALPLLRGREAAIGELPNGVDCSVFAPGPPPAALRARCGFAEEDRVLLLLAALDRAHYFKGVELLLEAMTRLPAGVKAIIAGDGDLRPAYEAQARRLGLATRAFFPGRVPGEALPDYYRLADATLLPSTTMGEAFGLVLIESLACGTPVIASNLPGVRTVVADGRDGLLVTPGDAADLARKIQDLVDRAGSKEEMGGNGRAKVVARYAWPVIGDRLAQVYASLRAPADELLVGRNG